MICFVLLSVGVFDKPFGGLHTILAGDFYQMKTISGTPIVQTKSNIYCNNLEALEGKKIFEEQMTHFVLLTENVRAESTGEGLSPLARFATLARLGDVSGAGVLETINQRVVNSVQIAMRDAHSSAVWITSTHRRINAINSAFLEQMTRNDQTPKIRLIAKHVPTKIPNHPPDEKARDILYSIGGGAKSKGSGFTSHLPTYMDLCIGSRVRIVQNLSTQCGLFNGAMGTVYGFVYEGNGPQTAGERVPTNFSSLEDEERELPIVLVRIDGDDESFPYSCSPEVSRLIPIVPIADSQRLSAFNDKYTRYMLPILPAHARTGHSVQGFTAINGVVVDPGSMFFAGDYVALSRAKDIEDIRLLEPVSEKNFTSHCDYRLLVHGEYLRLLNKFPQQLQRQPITIISSKRAGGLAVSGVNAAIKSSVSSVECESRNRRSVAVIDDNTNVRKSSRLRAKQK
jgi:hypothetical protein